MTGRGGGTEGRTPTTTRRLGRWLAASFMLVSSLVIVGSPAPAHAHIELVSSSPTLGADVPLATDRLRLAFGDDLFPIGHDISVRDPNGHEVTTGEPTAFGSGLEAPLALVAAGRHSVSYRAVGQDGHAVVGDLWFTVAAEGLPLPTAATASDVRASTAVTGAGDAGAPGHSAFASGTWLWGSVLGVGALLVVLHVRRHARLAVRVHREDG